MDAIKLLRKQIYKISSIEEKKIKNYISNKPQSSPRNNNLARVDFSSTFNVCEDPDLIPQIRLRSNTEQPNRSQKKIVIKSKIESKLMNLQSAKHLKHFLGETISAISYRDRGITRAYSPNGKQNRMKVSFRNPGFIAQLNDPLRGNKTPRIDHIKDNSDMMLEGKKDINIYKTRSNSQLTRISNSTLKNLRQNFENKYDQIIDQEKFKSYSNIKKPRLSKNEFKEVENNSDFKPLAPIVLVKSKVGQARANQNNYFITDFGAL